MLDNEYQNIYLNRMIKSYSGKVIKMHIVGYSDYYMVITLLKHVLIILKSSEDLSTIDRLLPKAFVEKVNSWTDKEKYYNHHLLNLEELKETFDKRDWVWLGYREEYQGVSVFLEHIEKSSYREFISLLYALEILPNYKIYIYDDIWGNYELTDIYSEGYFPPVAPMKFSKKL